MADSKTYKTPIDGPPTPPPTPLTDDRRVSHLHQRLQALRLSAAALAADYRNLGVLFYSFPIHLIHHNAILCCIRNYTVSQFVVCATRELPDMIQIIGLLDFILKEASELL